MVMTMILVDMMVMLVSMVMLIMAMMMMMIMTMAMSIMMMRGNDVDDDGEHMQHTSGGTAKRFWGNRLPEHPDRCLFWTVRTPRQA